MDTDTYAETLQVNEQEFDAAVEELIENVRKYLAQHRWCEIGF